MQIKNNYFLFYSILFALLLASSACNLTRVTANGDAANNQPQPAIANSPATDTPTVSSAEKKAPELTSQTIAGTYHYKTYKPNKGGNDNTLDITDKGNGKLHVSLSGSNVYMANGEPTMHEASGEGDAKLNGNVAIAQIVPDGDDRPCRVTISFTANQAKVALGKNCNFNVAFEGLYTKEKTSPISNNNQTKNTAAQPVNLPKVSYEKLSDFVNDFQKNKTGKSYVITDVPANKISKTERADKDGNKNLRGLYYFQTDENDTDASLLFIGSTALYKDYVAKVEFEPAKLRVTAVLVEFVGEFDIYRGSFVTKVEGLDDTGKVTWTINGTRPLKTSFKQ